MSTTCDCQIRGHEDSCVFAKRNKLVHRITQAIDTLPEYDDPAWETELDNIKCDINFVKARLKLALKEVENV